MNQTITANTIRVFAGGRSLSGGTLGVGGPGGFSVGGTQAFVNTVVGRGQSGALGPALQRTDFGPWGGAITFDSDNSTNWNFALTPPTAGSGQADFLSVALHELGHLLGIGTADSWKNLITGTTFNGPKSIALNGGVNPSTTADKGHFASGTSYLGQEVSMTPNISLSSRKNFTELDFGGLDDLGWNVVPVPEPATVLGLATAGLAGVWGVRRRVARLTGSEAPAAV